jgi:exopolysaccharide biosynthesis polyprenyl glycosylphosphotransferase
VITIRFSRSRSWYRQRVLVIGSSSDAARVVRRVDRHPEYGLDVVGTATPTGAHGGFRCSLGPLGPGDRERHEAVAKNPAELAALAHQVAASRAIVASGPRSMEGRSELMTSLVANRMQVDLVSGEPDLCSSGAAALHFVEGLPVLTVPAVQVTASWKLVKRSMDVVAAGLGLVLLAPFFGFCAIGIKLSSPGPVLFRQTRVGRGGRRFELLKFRTMVEDADRIKDRVASLNMHSGNGGRQLFKIPNDPRVTRFGAFLRRWSLDELPQLANVLKGDMSLVGPRPLIPEEAALVEGRYEVRLQMRPGITGPWQTLGRSDIGFEDMVKLDYTYVTNWTLSEDLKLLARTAGAVWRARGAY